MSTTAARDVPELFDDPSAWREQAIVALGLDGEDRCAGASTSPAMPKLIEELAERLDRLPVGPAADVGGGLGPASWWLTRRTRHRFVTIDASASSCAGARRLFGVAALRARSAALPVAPRSCSATLLNGVVSLLDDLQASVAEAMRITRPGGLVAVADLTAAGDQRVITASNTFWTADDLVAALLAGGADVDYYACCEPGIGRWAEVQSIVHDEIADRHAGERGFADWRDDDEQIAALIAEGRVAATCMIAEVPA